MVISQVIFAMIPMALLFQLLKEVQSICQI